MREFKFENKVINQNSKPFIIAEIGLNHNGDLEIAKQLMEVAKKSGCDAVKFQKRTPEISTPKNQWNVIRETPWGQMKYIDYRHKVEFSDLEYKKLIYTLKNLNYFGLLHVGM